MNRLSTRVQTPLLLTAICAVVLLVGAGGGASLERVATLTLISVVFAVGLSTFSGNSGVMSFGHVAFMAVGAYTTATPEDACTSASQLNGPGRLGNSTPFKGTGMVR